MDKKKYIGVVFSLALFAACSSEEGAGVTTEPAGDLDTRLSVLPQEPSAGQKAIMDSILKTMESGGGGTVENTNVVRLDSGIVEIDDPSVEIPVPQTAHDFETSGEVYYSRQGCNVTYYEAESGTQMLFTGTSADYMETSLLLTKDEVLIEKVENTYWFEEDKIDCEADLTAFRQRCESLYGVFRDYNDGTGCNDFRNLRVACAVPLFGLAITPEVLTHEADYYYKARCDSLVVAEGPQCSIVCTNPLENISSKDTVANPFDNMECKRICLDMEGEEEYFNVQGDDDDPFGTQDSESASSSEMPDLSGCASVHMSYRECEDNLDSMCSYLTCLDGNGNLLPLSNTQGDVSTSSASMPEAMSSASVDVTMSATSMESCYSVCENSLNGKCYTVCPDMDGEDGYFNVQDDEDEPFDAQGGVTMSSASMPFPVTSAAMPEAMSSASMP